MIKKLKFFKFGEIYLVLTLTDNDEDMLNPASLPSKVSLEIIANKAERNVIKFPINSNLIESHLHTRLSIKIYFDLVFLKIFETCKTLFPDNNKVNFRRFYNSFDQ